MIRIDSYAVAIPAHKLMAHVEPPVTSILALVSDPNENLKRPTLQPASAGLEQNIQTAKANNVALIIIFLPRLMPHRKSILQGIFCNVTSLARRFRPNVELRRRVHERQP